MHYLDESHILLFLIQIFILMGCARGAGELLRRWGQPALTGEILVGIFLGPTILGRLWPELQLALFPPDAIQQTMLDTVAWVGVLFLLLDTGLEIDFSIAWRQRGSAFLIAISDIIIPVAVGFAAVYFLPDRFLVNPEQRIIFALFMATVMTISAMPVAARVLHDLKLLKADLGFLVMSALAVNDIVGWVLFTIILGTFTTSTAAVGPIFMVFTSTVGFAALALTLGRPVSTRVFDAVKRGKFPEPATSLTITVLLGLLFGVVTSWLGIHALFGFFIAGVVVGEAKSLSEQTRGVISQMVHSLFVPLFFANIGLKMDYIADFNLPVVALICAAGIGGRYAGAWFGVTWARVPRINRDLISIAHTPGGMMEIVVALLALEADLITPAIFVAIVVSAVFSSMLMGPWMARSLDRRAAVTPARSLQPDNIVADLAGASRAEAVQELAERIERQAGSGTRDILVQMAMRREDEFGTAIGEGVAIPHARIDNLKNPVIAYGRSRQGIDWDAPDGVPVEDVFFFATPMGTEDIHVQTLSAIASSMASADMRRRLHAASGPEELYAILQSLLVGRKPHNRLVRT